MKNSRQIIVNEAGYNYEIPVYNVTNEGIKSNDEYEIQTMNPNHQITFCKGDKTDETKPRLTGVFVESLLEVVKHRLESVNKGELATRETALAITKIEEAIMWLEKRSNDRKLREVEGTYKK